MWKKLGGWVDAARKATLAALTAVGVGLMVTATGANAAIPEGVGTAVTAIGTDAQSVFDMVVPVVLSVLGLAVIVKLIKRFVNKI